MSIYRVSLKAARVNADMTLEQAAKAMGVNLNTISSWENKKTFPSAKQITKIEEVYSVPLEHLRFS